MIRCVFINLIFIFVTVIPHYADSPVKPSGLDLHIAENYLKGRAILNQTGYDEFRYLSSGLDESTRKDLRERYRLNPWLGAGINVLVPGLGSFIIGDYLSGIVVDGGLILWLVYGSFLPKMSFSSDTLAALAIGLYGVLIIGSYAYGLASPFVFANIWNTSLENGLGLTSWKDIEK